MNIFTKTKLSESGGMGGPDHRVAIEIKVYLVTSHDGEDASLVLLSSSEVISVTGKHAWRMIDFYNGHMTWSQLKSYI